MLQLLAFLDMLEVRKLHTVFMMAAANELVTGMIVVVRIN